jgi:hypothetical protein
MARPYNKRVPLQTEKTAIEKSVAVSTSAGGMPFDVVDVPTDVEELDENPYLSEDYKAALDDQNISAGVNSDQIQGTHENFDAEAVKADEFSEEPVKTINPPENQRGEDRRKGDRRGDVPTQGNLSMRVARAATAASVQGDHSVVFPLNQLELSLAGTRLAIPQILQAVDDDLRQDLEDLFKLL